MRSQSERVLLSVPRTRSVRYEKNYIKTAVCELRFPTLLEFSQKLPPKLQKGLRKEYPFFESVKDIDVSIHGAGPGLSRYLLKSKHKDWVVSITQSAISLETSRYIEFSDFRARLQRLLDVSLEFIDSDFFTRVGLRYINAIPILDEDITGWINPDLVTALISGTYGTVSQFRGEVHGYIEEGRYLFRYGLQPSAADSRGKFQFVLDYDYSAENVEADKALGKVTDFNGLNFSFFSWSIGPKARKELGESKQKS